MDLFGFVELTCPVAPAHWHSSTAFAATSAPCLCMAIPAVPVHALAVPTGAVPAVSDSENVDMAPRQPAKRARGEAGRGA